MRRPLWQTLSSIWGNKHAVRLVLTVAISAALIGLSLWGLAYLLEHADSNWVAAIQLFSTPALLAVTAVYVYLTYRLLYIQERPLTTIRLAAQEQVVRDVTELVMISYHAVASIADLFPLDVSKDATDYLNRHDDYLSTAGTLPDVLTRKIGGLPIELRPPTADAIAAVLRASTSFYVLQTCIYREQIRAAKQEIAAHEAGDETSAAVAWEGVRTIYYVEKRDKIDGKPEWEDLIGGKEWQHARNSVGELLSALGKYLDASA